jgi:phage shock protein C
MKQGRTPIYRSRRGVILGVCRGLAEAFGLDVFWLRAIVVLVMIFTAVIPVTLLYLAAALAMNPEPTNPFVHREGNSCDNGKEGV